MDAIIAVRTLGQRIADRIGGAGRFARFVLAVLVRIVARPDRWLRRRTIAPLLWSIGVATIPVVSITGLFIGMVMALESYAEFAEFGQEGRLGVVINLSVTKQIGPVLAAVMVAGRVGGALAAELGAMRVSEQIDAMRAMAADPLAHLVGPRVVACTLMTPLLTAYSDLLGVLGGWVIAVGWFGVSGWEYWHHSAVAIGWWDPVSGLLKSLVFGLAIGLVACQRGLSCGPGAAGVGRAATSAFVASFIAIIVLNLLLAQVLGAIGTRFLGAS